MFDVPSGVFTRKRWIPGSRILRDGNLEFGTLLLAERNLGNQVLSGLWSTDLFRNVGNLS